MIREVGKASRARFFLGECNRNGAVEQEAKIKEDLSTQGRSGYFVLKMDRMIRRHNLEARQALYTPDCQRRLHLGHVCKRLHNG